MESWTKEKPVLDDSKDYVIILATYSEQYKEWQCETMMLINDADVEYKWQIIAICSTIV